MNKKLEGIFPVLQIPFNTDGSVNESDLKAQIEFCIDAGAHGITVLAMASEFFTLSDEERKRIASIVIDSCRGRLPVIVGVSAPCKEIAAEFARHAYKSGADAIMALPPYVKRPANKDRIVAYYHTIASTVETPLILQNSPVFNNLLSVTEVLAIVEQVPSIYYIKEEGMPTGQRITDLLQHGSSKIKGVFGGANGLWLIDELRRGACGCMPTAAVVDVQVKIFELYRAGAFAKAQRLQNVLVPLLTLASLYGVSLAKYVLVKRGIISSTIVRDPGCVDLDQHCRKDVDGYLLKMKKLKILK